MQFKLTLIGLLAFAGVVRAQKEHGFDNAKPSGQPYLTPAESLKRMKVADGFEVKLFAAEPMVVNPIAFTIDERGRVWVVESFEYPSRTPKGKMPRDRIVILEDTDGDGVADKRTVFAEGKDFPERFDLASGIEVGYGGVFLGAPPNLWFIENKNDKPGKFEKLLGGFGSQDTHETLNTFQWGPDGWLYGLHGIFTESEVFPSRERERPVDSGKTPVAHASGSERGVKLNAGVWRYHPRTRKFEVFAEGTSNPWGWDYRNTDGQMILCCCVIPHLYHIIPGGIYKRQAGTSLNPYAYGQLNEISDHTFHKESGWAHAGLLSLDTPIMPQQYRDSVIFGSIHGCSLKRNVLKRNGSTFTASRADDFLVSGDKNFRPINLRWGPNADIFVSDWYDQNPCHQAKPEDWDYERGRIYRIQKKGAVTKRAEDLAALDTDALLKSSLDQNPFLGRTARRLVGERSESIPKDLRATWSNRSRRALLLELLGLLDANAAGRILQSSGIVFAQDPPPPGGWLAADREEVARAVGAWPSIPTSLVAQFADKARAEESPVARREYTSLARRIGPISEATDLVHALMGHREDGADLAIPLMIWLAYEPRLAAEPQAELNWLQSNAPGNALITDHIIARAMRRLVATGKAADLNACVAFVAVAKDAVRIKALEGLAEAIKGRQVDAPPEWATLAPALNADPVTKAFAQKLAVSFRDPAAVKLALTIAHDIRKPSAERAEAVRQLAQLKPPEALALFLSFVGQEIDPQVRLEAARGLAGYDDPKVIRQALELWKNCPPAVQSEIVNVAAGRKEWGRELLAAVEARKLPKTALHNNVVMRLAAFKDARLKADIERVWGKLRDTPADIAKLIDTMRGELEKAPGSFAKGKVVFDNQCAKCHKFEGRGYTVGPELDGAGRDVEYLLGNVLDPNRVVGQPYFIRRLLMKKGTVEEGLLHEEDAQKIALKGENDAVRVFVKSDIESIDVVERSMMPEGLGSNMTTQDFRDLVRYAMANPPINDWQVSGPFAGRVKENLTSEGPGLSGSKWERVRAGASGRVALPKNEKPSYVYLWTTVSSTSSFATRLEITGGLNARAWCNGNVINGGRIELNQGVNKLLIEVQYSGDGKQLSARFLDPDRRLKIE